MYKLFQIGTVVLTESNILVSITSTVTVAGVHDDLPLLPIRYILHAKQASWSGHFREFLNCQC